MFKNQMVNQIIEMEKAGKSVLLTDAGWKEFLRLMQEDMNEQENVKYAEGM